MTLRRPKCPRLNCPCTHDEPCDRGWINSINENGYQRVKPCPNCKPDLASIMARHRDDPEAFEEALQQRATGAKRMDNRVL
jgi:hypothetical protein